MSDGLGINNGELDTVIPGVALGVPHDFQIVWKADDTVEFSSTGTSRRRTIGRSPSGCASTPPEPGRERRLGVGERRVPVERSLNTSSVFDAGTTSRFGTLTSLGTLPATTTNVVLDPHLPGRRRLVTVAGRRR